MSAVREAWTDERLDDLNHRVDSGFGEIREEFRALRGETRIESVALRAEMKSEFTTVRAEIKSSASEQKKATASEFTAVRSEIAALSRTNFQMFATTMVTLILGLAGLFLTHS
jgi:hypothetical protein